MRIHFVVDSSNQIRLFDGRFTTSATVKIDKDVTVDPNIQLCVYQPKAGSLLKAVGQHYTASVENSGNCKVHEFIARLAALGGRQVVFDDRLKKFRNINSMKEQDDLWEAEGTGVTVSADSKEKATNRLATRVTKAMTDNPEKAAELAQWFASERPVKKLADGGLPAYTTVEEAFGKPEKETKIVIPSKEKQKAKREERKARRKAK